MHRAQHPAGTVTVSPGDSGPGRLPSQVRSCQRLFSKHSGPFSAPESYSSESSVRWMFLHEPKILWSAGNSLVSLIYLERSGSQTHKASSLGTKVFKHLQRVLQCLSPQNLNFFQKLAAAFGIKLFTLQL